MKTKAIFFIAICVWIQANAQVPVRKDDEFYKRLIVQRMDMDEKVNLPFRGVLRHPSDQDGPNGIVQTLLSALREGSIQAYHPDDLNKVMSYEDVRERMKEFEQALVGEDPYDTEVDTIEEFDVLDEFPDDPGFVSEDPTFAEIEKDEWDDLGNYESVIQWTEEWIFDKSRSVMVQQVKDIQLIWVDPGGAVLEKYLAVFKYGEAKEVLDEARWHNRHNDAAHLSLKEAFDMRMFHSYIINVSGKGVRSLWEAEQRRLALVEFEHHLWSY